MSSSDKVFLKAITGFKNWRKIKEKLDKHEQCKIHLSCLDKHHMSKQKKETGTVVTVMSGVHKLEVVKNVYYLNKVVAISIYLTFQRLLLRGHNKKIECENEGNLFASHDAKFQEGLEVTLPFAVKKSKQNYIIYVMANEIIIG